MIRKDYHTIGLEKEGETKSQTERRLRYEYLQAFRDAGGRFDISVILEHKSKKITQEYIENVVSKSKCL